MDKTLTFTTVTTGKLANKPITDMQCAVALSGDYTGLSFKFEGSVDGTNFFPIAAINRSTGIIAPGGTAISPSNATNNIWTVPCDGFTDIQIDVTAISTNTATFKLNTYSVVGSPFEYVNNSGATGSTATETLTNKTLTAPVINGASSASGNFDLSGSSGTFITSTGLNTLSGKVAQKVIATPVAAAGSSASDAAALGSANILTISSDSAAKGVKLVAGVAGDIVTIIATTATAAILYPATGGTINGGSANAGYLIPASKGTLCVCTATNTWTTYDLPAKSTAA